MGRWLVLVVLACGCRQLWGLGTPERAIDAGVDVPDAPPDVMVDAPLCFGTFGDAPYCLTARPTDPLTISQGMNIDTKSSMCAPEITSVCVIAATTIDVAAHVTATGELPLVLIATDTLNVTATGIVDVSSHRGGKRGAGSGATSCDVGQNPGAGGGGQGGSFGGAGGNGGDSSGNGGRAGMTIVPSVLRAGCDGQDGGGGGGANGIGGGAMYLIAGSSITIAGLVNASGSGGGGTSAAIRGGGGGGAGGMIVLESPDTVVSGLVIANGGGGGGGATATGIGQNGDDPDAVTPAMGGAGSQLSGDGGNGSGIASPTGVTGGNGSQGGGGGGGGGAGVIKTLGSVISNLLAVSPAPS